MQDFFIFNKKQMAISREKKESIVSELQEKLKNAKSSVFFDYTGINVKTTRDLKKKLKENNSEFFVAKKKLINIALKANEINGFSDIGYKGSCAVIFNNGDEISGVKSLYAFVKGYMKKNKTSIIKVIGGVYEGKIIPKIEVDNLSNVLSKNEFLSKFMFMLQYPASGIARAINAIKDKNGSEEIKETAKEETKTETTEVVEEKPSEAEQAASTEKTEPAAV